MSDDWKIPRCRADSLLTNSHIQVPEIRIIKSHQRGADSRN